MRAKPIPVVATSHVQVGPIADRRGELAPDPLVSDTADASPCSIRAHSEFQGRRAMWAGVPCWISFGLMATLAACGSGVVPVAVAVADSPECSPHGLLDEGTLELQGWTVWRDRSSLPP